jgi:hypothetical protein
MKKLLVLMMVLGLVSSAYALPSLSVNGDPAPDEITLTVSSVVTIDVESDTTNGYTVYLEMWPENTYGEWYSDVTVTADAGSLAAVHTTSYVGTYQLTAAGVTDYFPGVHFLIDFHCLAVGDVGITLYASDYSTVIDSMTIHQTEVPEPITIGLLGLGGLFLRRRK